MKKHGLVMLIFWASVFMFTLPILTCVESSIAAENELNIGGVFVLSGTGSESWARLYDGIKAGAAWINDKGGLTIKGDKYMLKIIAEDTKFTPDGMIAAANKLVFNDKVKFVIGGVPVPPMESAIEKVLQDNKVFTMQISGMGVKSEITPQKSYTFSTLVSRAHHYAGWENFVKLYPQPKTMAIAIPEDPTTIEDAGCLEDAAKAHGVKPLGLVSFPFATYDFYPTWTKILALKPEIVVLGAGIPEIWATIVKQGRELGFKGPFCCYQDMAPATTVRIAGDKYATDIFSTSFDFTSPKMLPLIKEIARVIKQKIGAEITPESFRAFEAIWALAQAIEHAQSIDPTAVKDSFEKMTKIDTPTGPGKLGGLKTYGINRVVLRPFPMNRIMNGKIEHLAWLDPVLP
jgi:branched-chain amino acid transport system substrate-binding protein